MIGLVDVPKLPKGVLKIAISVLVVPEVAPGIVPLAQFDDVFQFALVEPVFCHVPLPAKRGLNSRSKHSRAETSRTISLVCISTNVYIGA